MKLTGYCLGIHYIIVACEVMLTMMMDNGSNSDSNSNSNSNGNNNKPVQEKQTP